MKHSIYTVSYKVTLTAKILRVMMWIMSIFNEEEAKSLEDDIKEIEQWKTPKMKVKVELSILPQMLMHIAGTSVIIKSIAKQWKMFNQNVKQNNRENCGNIAYHIIRNINKVTHTSRTLPKFIMIEMSITRKGVNKSIKGNIITIWVQIEELM